MINPTLRDFNHKNSNQFLINCDWLQMHVETNFDFEEFENSTFKVHRTGRSKVFRSIFTIIYKKTGETVAIYATDAVEQIMKKRHGVIKIENAFLYYYTTRLLDFVKRLLLKLNMKFIGITRMDISYDFHSFQNRRLPENFIKAFLRNDIVKLKATKFRLSGDHGRENTYDWISFGSKTSTVNYKLYNKTKEQLTEKKKPYIWQEWEKAGLDTKRDIWRIEFSINSNTNTLTNDYGSFKFHSLESLHFGIYSNLFVTLFQHYFTFKKNDRAQARKDRMKDIVLLEFPKPLKPIHFKKSNPLYKDSNRSTKIFVNKLNGLAEEMRGKDDDFLGDAKTMIDKLINLYQLQDWAKQKLINFRDINYTNHLQELVYLNLGSS